MKGKGGAKEPAASELFVITKVAHSQEAHTIAPRVAMPWAFLVIISTAVAAGYLGMAIRRLPFQYPNS